MIFFTGRTCTRDFLYRFFILHLSPMLTKSGLVYNVKMSLEFEDDNDMLH